MNKLKKNITFAAVGNIAFGLLLFAAYEYIFRQIGCNCGVSVFEGTTLVNSCGCADQASFARVFGPLVIILPILTFCIITVVLLVKNKRQK